MHKSINFKHPLLSFLFVIIVCACADAQTYSSPESVEFDYANNRWFIANNGNGQILTRNSATGSLAVFATGIPSGPHGLEIVGDTLYACDGGTLKAYDINTATQVFNISLGASFLNGITHDNNGYLYITDFSGYKIYRFNTADRTFSVFVSNTGTSSPNGIIFDAANNRCIYVNWGSNAPIKAVDLTNGTISTITSTTLGSCDGIAADLNGNYYVSSWSGGNKITRFSNNFTTSTAVVTTGLSNPADIFYNVITDTLGVPNSGSGNNTAYYYFGTSSAVNEIDEAGFQMKSFIQNGVLQVEYTIPNNTPITLSVYDPLGRVLDSVSIDKAVKGSHVWNSSKITVGSILVILKSQNVFLKSRVILVQ
ncbi:MAG: hypothetical protein RL491_832 [Bacteroidota bacterium]|jgi:sugar lactone lactonase YvrE